MRVHPIELGGPRVMAELPVETSQREPLTVPFSLAPVTWPLRFRVPAVRVPAVRLPVLCSTCGAFRLSTKEEDQHGGTSGRQAGDAGGSRRA